MSEDKIRVRIRDRQEWDYGDDPDKAPDDGLCGGSNSDDGSNGGGGDDGDSGDDGNTSAEGSARPTRSEGTYSDEEPVFYGDTWNVVVETINETGEKAAGTVGVTIDGKKNTSRYQWIPAGTEVHTFSDVGPIEKQSEEETQRDVCVGAFLDLKE